MTVKPRCVNLDWLEVYCLEPINKPRDASYFASQGFCVQPRDYGTRVYEQMFTLLGTDELPLLEVRRQPKSALQTGGILPINACHIRLCNRTCYYDDAAMQLKTFIEAHGFDFQRISRVDICLDFERFDSGDYPEKFLRRYLQEVYLKINQAKVHNHGEDGWLARRWNSISWGSEKSQIGTKFYNKTLQLQEVKDKPYIKQAWFICGLVDNPITCIKYDEHGRQYTPSIWRLEFSIRSSVKGWFTIEEDGNFKKKRSIPNNLDMYADRQRILALFASLQQHYFRFKMVRAERKAMKLKSMPPRGITAYTLAANSGAFNDLSDFIPRKDRCPDKILFKWIPGEPVYHVQHPAGLGVPMTDSQRLLKRLYQFRTLHPGHEIQQAIDVIVKAIDNDTLRSSLACPWSLSELQALQKAISYRDKHKNIDPTLIINEVKTLLEQATDAPF